MARATVRLFSHMPIEWTFALLGFQNVPGRVCLDWPPKMEQLRLRIMAELLRRHDIGTPARKATFDGFIDGLDPRDWPRPRKPSDDLFNPQADWRTPLDVAEVWGLDWLKTQLMIDIRDATERRRTKNIAQLVAALDAVSAVIMTKSAAIGGYYEPFGRDPTTGRSAKVSLCSIERAWETLRRKLGQLDPIVVLPVLMMPAAPPRKPGKAGKPRLVHSRPAATATPPGGGAEGGAA